MKKWKILIPSLVATASMPLIGLVGCGEESIDWGTVYQLDTECIITDTVYTHNVLSTNDLLALKAGQKYTFVIDLTNWAGFIDAFQGTWCLRFWTETSECSTGVDVNYDSIRVWRNGDEQKCKSSQIFEEGYNDFCLIEVRDDLFGGVDGYHGLTPPLASDEYRIQFILNSDFNDVRVYFADEIDLD